MNRALSRSRELSPNFEDGHPMTPERGWNQVATSSLLAVEAPGPPLPDGPFARAREAMKAFEFSDRRIVDPHFDPALPLQDRHIVLELKALGVHLLCPVRVEQVRDEASRTGTLFAFSIETLDGHIEEGREWFTLHKDAVSGEVRFSIEAAWRAGRFPTFWTYAGFRLLGRRYQRAWHRLAHVRLARIARNDDRRPP